MSFLSSVNFSKADSMAALSVLLSTTRKFFCASAPAVTCYCIISSVHVFDLGACLRTPMPARRSPVTESCIHHQYGCSLGSRDTAVIIAPRHQ